MQFCPLEPQTLIIQHLRRCPNALVFAAMGISKTAAVLQHLCDLFLSGEAIAALIVAPLRVASLTWPMECQKWSPFKWLKVANLRTEHGQRAFLNGKAHLYTINYDSMKLLVDLVERRKGVLPYDCVVFDECTRAKNPSSKRVNLYRRKVTRPPRNILLTGTPQPNSSLDLFAQVRLCDDGERLGRNYTDFKKQYFFPPENAFQPGAKWRPKAQTEQQIEQRIHDITITLKASDWLNIPDTEIIDVEIEFPPALRKQYEILEEELVLELKTKTMNVANSAALITKLLQFTSGHVYDEERNVHAIHDLKFEAIAKIVKQERNVFCAYIFQHEEKRLRELFPTARFFSDAKNEVTQKKLLDDWNAGRIKLMVGHPASMGHGLNVQHGGHVVIWPTLTHNREWNDQLIARFARRGQTEITKVYRLMINNTVDWAVAEALAAKASNEARLISALQMLESMRAK